ncbi:hypothetical protein F4V91_08780 [Neorhizobium galegae]|uniref:Uncharacterized protein n=1 Tax=Neorhizobium galegae TaxID=399 RepID=A0A6A1TPH3_NEOGA|nr:hypothetical protein [Neorhizobium galegae]KAB1086513.1 hypothetical protein F4V91_08780 [Neorhizobium galegae]
MSETTFPEEFPEGAKGGKYIRGALNAAGGLIPFAGGLISAAASTWGEHEQDRMNDFFRHWIEMLRAEMEEKQQTILEIMQRVDLRDEEVAKRVESPEYQSLLRKSFRDWAGAESEQKRGFIRNVLANTAATAVSSDDVVRLFLDWIKNLSELHLLVIAKFYNQNGLTRREVWSQLGREPVREDSAEADLFRLLIRDLSTGGIIRQHRQTDYHGNFVKKPPQRSRPGTTSNTHKSAFDDEESYELTALGNQFVHYAMTDVPIKLAYNPEQQETPNDNRS